MIKYVPTQPDLKLKKEALFRMRFNTKLSVSNLLLIIVIRK